MSYKYIIKRILYSILVLFLVSLCIYLLVRCLPSDYVDKKYEAQLNQGVVTQEFIDEMKAIYGLDDNSFFGIIKGYFKWLGNVFQGNLGMSFKYEAPVNTVIAESMWISFGVSILAFILQSLIAVPLGIKAATSQYSAFDYGVTVFTVIGISLPSFFLGTLLIKFLGQDLGWFPMQGISSYQEIVGIEGVLDVLWHLVLPMVTVVLVSLGGLMRHTRTNTLEVLNSDYIRTARAKGLSEKKVIYKHVFRNTMIPMVTMMAGVLPSLFGGMMILEEVFALPGIGQKAYVALGDGDIPFIMGYCMFLAILTVIGTLLTDLAYMLVDPRVKLEK